MAWIFSIFCTKNTAHSRRLTILSVHKTKKRGRGEKRRKKSPCNAACLFTRCFPSGQCTTLVQNFRPSRMIKERRHARLGLKRRCFCYAIPCNPPPLPPPRSAAVPQACVVPPRTRTRTPRHTEKGSCCCRRLPVGTLPSHCVLPKRDDGAVILDDVVVVLSIWGQRLGRSRHWSAPKGKQP